MIRPVLVAIALVLGAHPAAAIPSPSAPDAASGTPTVTRCATPDVSRAEADRVQARIRQFRGLRSAAGFRVTIPIAFHVITCRGEGDVPQSQLVDQVRELSKAYRGTGFSFVLSSVDRTENCSWFSKVTGPGVEKKMKQTLATDPAHHLNVYVLKPGHGYLGWAYFPQSVPEDSYWHGVVMHYGTLPGNFLVPYNLGGTLDHEVGHYLGLFHTFQGGCVEPGDYVDDTAFEVGPAFGCPIGLDTCPQPGEDPIHNYMDYTDDACYSEITAGQTARMQLIVPAYRPSLFNTALAQADGGPSRVTGSAASGLAFRGAMPNPFSYQTTLHFALPSSGHVSLELFDVAGQRITVLADDVMPAGEQSVALPAGALAPGMYFAALRFGGETKTRTVILLP